QTGLELVERKLRSLSADDCDRQSWFIRASLSVLAEEVTPARRLPPPVKIASEPISKAKLIAAAREVGDRLEKTAYRGNGDALWLGLTLAPQRRWEENWALAPIGVDLYDGLPGIALFLAHLGRITGERRYTDLARGAIVSARRQIADRKHD